MDMRIAVVGSGVAGLVCAHLLDPDHDVTIFEASGRLGGHSNTVMVEDPEVGPLGVDTGFIVHNDRNYPNLLRLFAELKVPTQESEMSFSVTDDKTGFTYRATNLATLLAKPSNALDPRMWRMLYDIVRFYRHGRRFLADPDPALTIGELIDRGSYSATFIDLHLLPMGAAVWSTSPEDFRLFPALTLLRFLENHGLLGVGDRPQWRTVTGGSVTYVKAIADRFCGKVRLNTPVLEVRRLDNGDRLRQQVRLSWAEGSEEFDAVIMACHSDQALAMLTEPTDAEHRLLNAIPYRANKAVLHTDTTVLSPARRAWAAWNYHTQPDQHAPQLTYDLTNLQRLPGSKRYLLTLNPDRDHRFSNIIATFDYAHPQFSLPAIKAQSEVEKIDGHKGIYYCGAYWGNGFHEDGMNSALRVCQKLGVTW